MSCGVGTGAGDGEPGQQSDQTYLPAGDSPILARRREAAGIPRSVSSSLQVPRAGAKVDGRPLARCTSEATLRRGCRGYSPLLRWRG